MNIDFSGKTAVVTGSTSGIGLACAQGLAASGASVVVNGRTKANVDQAMATIKRNAPRAELRGVVADLATAGGCAKFIAAVPKTDILANNVGIYGPQDFFAIPDEEWTRFFETNVMSGVRLSRAYAEAMVAQKWGRIVFISSESALNIPADMIHYGFTKTANLSVSRGLAKRLAGTGVTVNAVLPGPTLTEGVAAMLRETAEQSGQTIDEAATAFIEANRPSSIIKRAATPEEVANMVVYTCSREASATSGAALRVDGGVIDTIA